MLELSTNSLNFTWTVVVPTAMTFVLSRTRPRQIGTIAFAVQAALLYTTIGGSEVSDASGAAIVRTTAVRRVCRS